MRGVLSLTTIMFFLFFSSWAFPSTAVSGCAGPHDDGCILVVDTFDGDALDADLWQVVSGSWFESGGYARGDWPQGCAQCVQGNLVLQPGVSPEGDFLAVARTDAEVWHGGMTFVLYKDNGNKYNVGFGAYGTDAGCDEVLCPGRVAVELRANGHSYVNVESNGQASGGVQPHVACAGRPADQGNTFALLRRENTYSTFVNGEPVFTFNDVRLGDVRLGIGAYGQYAYDQFLLVGLPDTFSATESVAMPNDSCSQLLA